MAAKVCKKEFSVRNFGFSCNVKESNLFYISQWGKNRVAFSLYRVFMALFSLGWTIGIYGWCSIHCKLEIANSYRYITLWSDVIRTFYFVIASVLALVGLVNERKHLSDRGYNKCLRNVTWFSHNLAMMSNTVVTMLFWPLVAKTQDPAVAFGAISVYLHSVNLPLLLVDFAIAAFPIRLLHFIYGSMLAVVYGIFTVILWKVGDADAVYEVLDWENGPVLAALLIAGSCFVGPPIIQVILFLLYMVRKFIGKFVHKRSSQNFDELSENMRLNSI